MRSKRLGGLFKVTIKLLIDKISIAEVLALVNFVRVFMGGVFFGFSCLGKGAIGVWGVSVVGVE